MISKGKVLLSLLAAVLLQTGVARANSLRIGAPIASLRLPDLSGRQVDTAAFKGKTLVIYFWNDRCGCAEQLVELRSFINAQKGKAFSFVTVNEGQGKRVAQGFITANSLPYQVLLDDDLKAGRRVFGIKVLPTVFIAGKDGILREKLIGVVDSRRLERLIARYL